MDFGHSTVKDDIKSGIIESLLGSHLGLGTEIQSGTHVRLANYYSDSIPDQLPKGYTVFDTTPEMKWFPSEEEEEEEKEKDSARNQLNFIFAIYGKMTKSEFTYSSGYLELTFK